MLSNFPLLDKFSYVTPSAINYQPRWERQFHKQKKKKKREREGMRERERRGEKRPSAGREYGKMGQLIEKSKNCPEAKLELISCLYYI